MAGDRYPEFYLRKRQRDRAYRRASLVVVGIVAFFVVGCAVGYWVWTVWLGPPRSEAAPAALAEEREELETGQLLSQGAERPTDGAAGAGEGAADQAGAAAADLSDLEYEQSFPPIHIEVSSADGEGSGAASGDATEDESGSQEASSGDGTAADAASGDQGADAGDEAAETAAPPAERPGAREEPAPEQPRPDSGSASAPATEDQADESEAEEDDSADLPPPDEGGYIYHVYAGSFSSREQAEAVKGDLSALGYMATLVVLEPDYLLRVATLSDFNAADALKHKLVDSGFTSAFATRSRR